MDLSEHIADLLAAPSRQLAQAPVVREARARGVGFVTAIDTRALGVAVVALGGGRRRAGDAIDPAVGLSELAPLGADVSSLALARIHARDEASADAASQALRAAYAIGEARREPAPAGVLAVAPVARHQGALAGSMETAPGLQQGGDIGRIILAIAIERRDDRARCRLDARAQGGALSAAAPVIQNPEPGKISFEPGKPGQRVIGAAVVNIDDLVSVRPADGGFDFLDQRAQILVFVMDGHNDA